MILRLIGVGPPSNSLPSREGGFAPRSCDREGLAPDPCPAEGPSSRVGTSVASLVEVGDGEGGDGYPVGWVSVNCCCGVVFNPAVPFGGD